MAITPVTNFRPVRGQSITFSGRNNNYEQNIEYDNGSSHSSSMSGLRKVPVIVLMAMSPLTVPNAAASEISEPEPVMVETMSAAAQQQQKPKLKVIGSPVVLRERIDNLDTRFSIAKLDKDGNPSTSELLLFIYEHNIPNTQNKMRLEGFVLGIYDDPINSKGDYMISYYVKDKSGEYSERVCKVPAKYGKGLLNMMRSPEGKDKLLPLVDKVRDHYIINFGVKGITPPSISGEANTLIKPGCAPTYVTPAND